MPLLDTTYCTIEELQRFLGATAVASFADHDGDLVADEDVIEDAINQATEEIDLYATQRYTQDVLLASTLVKRWCVVLSARFLCHRRGNIVPDTIELEWQRIEERLIQISKGLLQLPGVPLRGDLRPTWSNHNVDRRFRNSKVRVTRRNSSSAPTKLTQDIEVDHNAPWD